MKKYYSLLPFAFLAIFAFYITGCKKCYICQDDCVLCTLDTFKMDTILVDSVVKVYYTDSLEKCNDYFPTDQEYTLEISKDSAKGYTCKYMDPWYKYEYCINKPGDESYPGYYNLGGRAKCTEK